MMVLYYISHHSNHNQSGNNLPYLQSPVIMLTLPKRDRNSKLPHLFISTEKKLVKLKISPNFKIQSLMLHKIAKIMHLLIYFCNICLK